jgi:hypothetical protein
MVLLELLKDKELGVVGDPKLRASQRPWLDELVAVGDVLEFLAEDVMGYSPSVKAPRLAHLESGYLDCFPGSCASCALS